MPFLIYSSQIPCALKGLESWSSATLHAGLIFENQLLTIKYKVPLAYHTDYFAGHVFSTLTGTEHDLLAFWACLVCFFIMLHMHIHSPQPPHLLYHSMLRLTSPWIISSLLLVSLIQSLINWVLANDFFPLQPLSWKVKINLCTLFHIPQKVWYTVPNQPLSNIT